MKLDISSLKNALTQLETSMNYYHSNLAKKDPGLCMQFRNSAIQCFEFTYELCYKMLRRQLDQVLGNPQELREMNFADFIRTAAEAGLVTDVKAFLRYRECRNMTGHTYNQKRAEEVVAVLDGFIQDVKEIILKLEKRNDHSNK